VQQPIHSPIKLYDIESDIGEQNDIAAGHPEIVKRLAEYMEDAYTPSDQWKWRNR
jgi:hypothetical protein